MSRKAFALAVSMFAIMFLFSSTAFAAGFSVGYVNLQKVFDEYKGAQSMNKKLIAEKDKRQTELDGIQESIKAMKDDYDKEKDEKKKADMEKAMEKSLKELQAQYMKLSGELQEAQAKEFKGLEGKVLAAVKRVAEAKAYDLVLDRGFVFYGGTEITEDVIAELNKGKASATVSEGDTAAPPEKKPEKKKTKKTETTTNE
jgi:outer membrane protein